MAVYKTIFECLLSWFLSSIQFEFFWKKISFFIVLKNPLDLEKNNLMQVDSDYINFIVKSVERSYFKFTLFVKSPRKRNEYAFCPFCLNLYIPSKCHKKGGHLQYYHQSKNLPIPDVVLRKWRRMLEKYPESIYSYALEKAIEIETQERLNKFEAERR